MFATEPTTIYVDFYNSKGKPLDWWKNERWSVVPREGDKVYYNGDMIYQVSQVCWIDPIRAKVFVVEIAKV